LFLSIKHYQVLTKNIKKTLNTAIGAIYPPSQRNGVYLKN